MCRKRRKKTLKSDVSIYWPTFSAPNNQIYPGHFLLTDKLIDFFFGASTHLVIFMKLQPSRILRPTTCTNSFCLFIYLLSVWSVFEYSLNSLFVKWKQALTTQLYIYSRTAWCLESLCRHNTAILFDVDFILAFVTPNIEGLAAAQCLWYICTPSIEQ